MPWAKSVIGPPKGVGWWDPLLVRKAHSLKKVSGISPLPQSLQLLRDGHR